MNNRQTGNAYEQMAAEYLQKKGMIILDRNFRRGRNGEIDIVGRDGKYLVFVDRCLHNYNDNTWVRYDVVAIQGEKIQWIPNAFPHYYRTRG